MDQSLFLAINHLPHTVIFDALAKFLSGIGQWGAIWFLIAIILFFREEKRDKWFFLPTILAISLGYVISEIVLKNIFLRPRPPGAMLSDYSFPSTHATIAWAMAFVLSHEEPKLSFWFYLLAILISISRIYLGVHYPSDVIAGALLGLGLGWMVLMVEQQVTSRRLKKKH